MRYSGANNLECNLYNQEGMPASPFLAGWSADARRWTASLRAPFLRRMECRCAGQYGVQGRGKNFETIACEALRARLGGDETKA